MNKSSIAAFLSFIYLVGGQIYNGDFGKAFRVIAVLVGTFFTVTLIGLALGEAFAPLGMMLLGMVFLICWIYCINDAYESAGESESNVRQALERHRQEHEKYAPERKSEPPPPLPPGGFRRKIKGQIKFKPFEPID